MSRGFDEKNEGLFDLMAINHNASYFVGYKGKVTSSFLPFLFILFIIIVSDFLIIIKPIF
jgi:hypothetical protein